MNNNEVIRAFDVNDITRDNNNLYLKFTIDRKKASIKKAKFIKVCIESPENIVPPISDKNDIFLDKLTKEFRSKSSPLGLSLHRFEDNILDLTITEDEVTNFKEYFLSISMIKVKSAIGDSLSLINPELPHIFKVYILDKNKNILEKYNYASDYKIMDYTLNNEVDDFVFNTLESSIDLVFTPYNTIHRLGPYLKVNNELLDNPALDLKKIELQITYDGKNYNFAYEDFKGEASQNQISQAFSQKAISAGLVNSGDLVLSIFERDVLANILIQNDNQFITDLFKSFHGNSLVEDTIDYRVIYEDDEIVKSKVIDRSTVESLYFSYFQKNKSRIINSLMSSPSKISIRNIDDHSGFKILFRKFERHMLPISASQTSFKIYKVVSGIRTEIRDLYTSASFDEDLKMITYSNQGFLLESIYDNPNKNSEFFVKSNEADNLFVVCLNNIEVFRGQLNNPTIVSQQETTPARSSDLFFSINSCFKNARLTADRRIMFDFDKSELSKNKETAAMFGYNVNNNDNLDTEIINNSIAIFTVSSNDSFRESITAIRVKDILENNHAFLNISFFPEEIKVKSIMQPFGMADLVISNQASDDNKEIISSFLNNIVTSQYSSISRLVDSILFNGLSQYFVIEEIFRILGNNVPEKSFLIDNAIDLDSLLNNVIEIEEDSGI